MGKFEILTKYIDSFSVDEFQSDECLKIMKNFVKDTRAFAEQNHLTGYSKILDIYGINWDRESMEKADATKLPADAICALLIGLVRAEEIFGGVLIDFLKKGIVQSWLVALKTHE